MAEKLEDLNLPNAVVLRIIKQAISEDVCISREARSALGRAASVFVLYITSAACGMSRKVNRKTLTAQDVLDAMVELEFEDFVEPLKEHLEAFRKSKKDAVKGKQKTENDPSQDMEDDSQINEEEDDDEM